MIQYQPCFECGVPLRPYWLKNGVCNGCRNPHLIVTAQVTITGTVFSPRIVALTSCDYCTSEITETCGMCADPVCRACHDSKFSGHRE